MSAGPRRRDWQEAVWTVGSKLMIAAIAVVAVVAGALVLVRGNAVPATVLVAVGQENGGSAKADQYNPAAIGVTAGDTVRWEWFGGVHDVASYAESAPGTPEWQSDLIRAAGNFYERQFTAPGAYTYYCSIHAFPEEAAPAVIDANIAAGKMVGKVVVAAPVTPTPSPSPPPSPSPSPTAVPTASPTPTPPGASATPTPPVTASVTPAPTGVASATPAPSATPTPPVTASATPSPTAATSATPVPSGSPAPTAEPSDTPDPVETSTPTPAPTEDPQPTATPPETPSPAPTGPATATPAPTSSPAVTAAPVPTSTSAPAQALGGGVGPQRFPTTGAVVSSEEGGISPVFRVITLSLTGLLIAIVISGFIWIERSQRDQPR